MEQISQCSHFHSFYNHPNSKLYFLLCLKILSCGTCADDSGTVILVGRYLRALPLQRRFISRVNLITAVHAFMSTHCCSLLQYPLPCYTMPCYAMPCYAMPGRPNLYQLAALFAQDLTTFRAHRLTLNCHAFTFHLLKA